MDSRTAGRGDDAPALRIELTEVAQRRRVFYWTLNVLAPGEIAVEDPAAPVPPRGASS